MEPSKHGRALTMARDSRRMMARVANRGLAPRCSDRWGRFLPEALALTAIIAGVHIHPGLALVLPIFIRAAMQAAAAVHELGHALAGGAAVLSHLPTPTAVFSPRALLPMQPIYIPGFSDPDRAPQLSVGVLSQRRRRWAAIAGPAANLVFVSALIPAIEPSSGMAGLAQVLLLLLTLSNLWVIATSWTDYASLISGKATRLYCGNFGILAKRMHQEHGFLPRRFRSIVQRLGETTDIRGQQAGGLAVMSASGRFVGRKIVNDKRGNLTRDLIGSFRRRALLCRIGGRKPRSDVFHLVGHYRYGTSSGPSVLETHWHRWQRPRMGPVWSVDGRRLVRRRRIVENLITHNGDFDTWRAPWARQPVSSLGSWLAEVLDEHNPAQGDSPKIAGMLDLLNTQGQWGASLRLAYAMQTGSAPPARYLKELTRVSEQVFRRWAGQIDGAERDSGAEEQGRRKPTLCVVGCASLAEVFEANAARVQELVDGLWQASLPLSRVWLDELGQQHGRLIINRAVHAFFHNDLYQATQLFMERAEGTFGLVTTTSLQPGAVALAADRQPLFIGADPQAGLLVYASEAAALKVAGTPSADGSASPVPYRFDLRDGDVVWLQVNADTADNTMTVLNRYLKTVPVEERITPEALAASACATAPTALASEPSARRWIALHHNRYVQPCSADTSRRGVRDRVLAEMTEIPSVLERVQAAWDDPDSPNRRTAQAFSAAFLDSSGAWRTHARSERGPTLNATLDLLVLGVENSLYAGQRFTQDLSRVFPYLHVEAVDAVSYCEDPQRFAVGAETVTLALSHSGQTFNTLDAVKFLQGLHGLGKAGPVFVMTGEVDTLIGAAVGQGVHVRAPWQARVFATCAGWRTAEPATVSTAAMHASLTQLLLRLARDGRAAADTGGEQPFGLTARGADLDQVEALARLSVSRAESLLGCTAEGWTVVTDERAGLIGHGRYLARLITEPALVFLVTATHLFVMLWLGWTPVVAAQDLLNAATDFTLFDAGTAEGKLLKVLVETAYFLFAGVAFTLLLRWIQGRPLWDRVFVGRTLVLGDEPYVKSLLSQYVSKLFSLAYEFTGFVGIHAADTRSSDLLHTYGHRMTRGLVLYLGLPDGRWPGRERAEAAVCMTSSQARGVQNLGTGAFVLGTGHNPASAEKVDRFALLGPSPSRAEVLPWALRGRWSALARELQESRFESFERLLASYVVFHVAAANTRDFINPLVPIANLLWSPVFLIVRLLTGGRVRPRFGRWDLSRTQSGTRIATTAAPVSANSNDPHEYLMPAERYAAQPASLREDTLRSVLPLHRPLVLPGTAARERARSITHRLGTGETAAKADREPPE